MSLHFDIIDHAEYAATFQLTHENAGDYRNLSPRQKMLYRIGQVANVMGNTLDSTIGWAERTGSSEILKTTVLFAAIYTLGPMLGISGLLAGLTNGFRSKDEVLKAE